MIFLTKDYFTLLLKDHSFIVNQEAHLILSELGKKDTYEFIKRAKFLPLSNNAPLPSKKKTGFSNQLPPETGVQQIGFTLILVKSAKIKKGEIEAR